MAYINLRDYSSIRNDITLEDQQDIDVHPSSTIDNGSPVGARNVSENSGALNINSEVHNVDLESCQNSPQQESSPAPSFTQRSQNIAHDFIEVYLSFSQFNLSMEIGLILLFS